MVLLTAQLLQESSEYQVALPEYSMIGREIGQMTMSLHLSKGMVPVCQLHFPTDAIHNPVSCLCWIYLNFQFFQLMLHIPEFPSGASHRTVWVLPKCFIVLSTKFGSREWKNCLVVNTSDFRFNHSLPPLFSSEESSFSFPSLWFLILEKRTQLLTMLVVEDSITCSLLYNRSLYWLGQVSPGLIRQAGVIITWTHTCWVLQNFSSQEPKSYSVFNKSCLRGGF